ncbi:MAG: substrate-binding domain-containing protein [Victivallales bacterium]|nr:substrate-binding domain-containing protein [Victivallales bacterium]
MHKKTTEILSKMRTSIQNGKFSDVSFLPAERELCLQYGLSRGALRGILEILEGENLLRRIPGRGMKVLSPYERLAPHKFLLVLPNRSMHANEVAELLRGTAMAAEENNAEVVLFFQRKDMDGARLLGRLAENQWSGVIIYEQVPDDLLKNLQAGGYRYCIANSEEASDTPAVRVDFRAVGRLAGHYLMEHGLRHIGFIGGCPPKDFHYREMLAGLKGALAEEDLQLEKRLVFQCPVNASANVPQIAAALEKMAGRRCAIFAGRDRCAAPIYEACRLAELRIPEDVAVLGYDGLSWPDASGKGLTSIRQPAIETGQMPVLLLCQAVEQGTSLPPLTLVPPGEILERSSVSIPTSQKRDGTKMDEQD